MHDYLATVLIEHHRRQLLAEARAEALAREARAGREPWWHRLFHRAADGRPASAAASVRGGKAATLVGTR